MQILIGGVSIMHDSTRLTLWLPTQMQEPRDELGVGKLERLFALFPAPVRVPFSLSTSI